MNWLEQRYNDVQTVRERIKQRRAQLLIHSALYYTYDSPLVPDATWDRWAAELVKLHELFGPLIQFYDGAFEGWDGSTGYHLPLRDPFVTAIAERLMRHRETRQEAG